MSDIVFWFARKHMRPCTDTHTYTHIHGCKMRVAATAQSYAISSVPPLKKQPFENRKRTIAGRISHTLLIPFSIRDMAVAAPVVVLLVCTAHTQQGYYTCLVEYADTTTESEFHSRRPVFSLVRMPSIAIYSYRCSKRLLSLSILDEIRCANRRICQSTIQPTFQFSRIHTVVRGNNKYFPRCRTMISWTFHLCFDSWYGYLLNWQI